jgi:hypothetical protein
MVNHTLYSITSQHIPFSKPHAHKKNKNKHTHNQNFLVKKEILELGKSRKPERWLTQKESRKERDTEKERNR